MPTTLNIATDYTIFDNYQTVAVVNTDASSVSSVRAVKETISQQPGTINGYAISVIRCRWHLFVNQLGTFVPAEHGYLTDEDGTKHYIDEGTVRLASWDTRYEFATTAEAAATVAGV